MPNPSGWLLLVAKLWRLCRARHNRHSLGTHMAEGGIPVQIIQRRLGHRHIQNTMIYLSLADELVDRAVAEAAEKGYVV